ncbi:MAG: winged helix-turn-helix domain-containing protein [Nitrososphaerales archaeon]
MVIPYRNGIKIVGDVLNITSDFGVEGVNITLLLRKANLSYNRLVKLARQLTIAGLLEERLEEGKRVYMITEKGKEYLKTYAQFESLASSFGLEL